MSRKDATTTQADQMHDAVKNMALKLYREKGIKTSCERCYYTSDPTCPDFPHICMLEEALKTPGESRTWALENLAPRIKMRKRALGVDPS